MFSNTPEGYRYLASCVVLVSLRVNKKAEVPPQFQPGQGNLVPPLTLVQSQSPPRYTGRKIHFCTDGREEGERIMPTTSLELVSHLWHRKRMFTQLENSPKHADVSVNVHHCWTQQLPSRAEQGFLGNRDGHEHSRSGSRSIIRTTEVHLLLFYVLCVTSLALQGVSFSQYLEKVSKVTQALE